MGTHTNRWLCCCQTGTDLQDVCSDALTRLNQAIAAGQIVDSLGRAVTEPLEAALVNGPRTHLYRVVNGVPSLLPDEAIEVAPFQLDRGREETEA